MTTDEIATRLGEWAAKRLTTDASAPPSDVRVSNFRRHTEGFSWQTFTFDVEWHDTTAHQRALAVRREPEDGLLAPYDIVGQYRLHEVLLTTEVPVPNLVGLELDRSIVGMPFYAMDKIDGIVPVQWKGNDASVFPDDATRHSIGCQFVDRLAEIHAIDWARHRLDQVIPALPTDTDAATAELDRWERLLDESTLVEIPLLRSAIAWCRRNRATTGRTVLCHGDYRIGNFMVDRGRITAVFDWELAHIGDPVEDLAWANLQLFRGRSELMSQLIPLDEALARYRDQTGLVIDKDVFRFWSVVCTIRAAVPHVRAAAAFESGRSSDVRLAAMGHQTLHVLAHLANQLGAETGAGS